MKQRTEQWHEARRGMFTGSVIHNLFKKGRRKDEYFGKSAMSYIRSVAMYELTGYREDIQTYQMRRGVELEPFAVELYQLKSGVFVQETGFHTYNDIIGASPDGLIGRDCVLEVKCPSTDVHTRYILMDDLMVEAPEYYYQVQCEMLCTGSEHAIFVSYHPGVRPLNMRVMDIEWDQAVIEEMIERADKAKVIKEEIIEELKKKPVFEEKRNIPDLIALKDFE